MSSYSEKEFTMSNANDGGRFINFSDRQELRKISRDAKETVWRARRALMLLALDAGHEVNAVASIHQMDEKSVYNLRTRYEKEGLAALDDRPKPPRGRRLNEEQLAQLRAHLIANPPAKTADAVKYVKEAFGVDYANRGMSDVLNALGFRFRKPKPLPRVADEEAQRECIAQLARIKAGLGEREALFYMDAVHPEHQAQPACAWFHESVQPATLATTGRQRMNVIGAIDVADGTLIATDQKATVKGESIAAFFRTMHERLRERYTRVYVVLDNAGYHRGKTVKKAVRELKGWLQLEYLPAYAPHLNPIERLWGVMRKWVTHNRCYETFSEFCAAISHFLHVDVAERWDDMKSCVTDNFRVISHDGYEIYA